MRELPPLSHHEILRHVGPFSRRGLRVDLAASDRNARLLRFGCIDHPALPGEDGAAVHALPPLREQLSLDLAQPQRPQLTRTLTGPGGLCATLTAEGGDADDPGALLDQMAAVPASRQWRRDGGLVWALSHRALAGSAKRRGAPPTLVLREAEARLGPLRLRLWLTGVRGYPAEIELRTDDAAAWALPTDLLAVQGRAWSRLTASANGHGWRGHVALRGDGAQRGLAAEALFHRMVQHLCQTLTEPPPRFHARHRAARWGVTLRELGPMGLGLGIVALALALRDQGGAQASMLALMANVAPPLLMMLFFVRREMPYIGLPRVPRGPAADAWPVAPAST